MVAFFSHYSAGSYNNQYPIYDRDKYEFALMFFNENFRKRLVALD